MAVTFGNVANQRIDCGTVSQVQNLASKTFCWWMNPTTLAAGEILGLFPTGATDEEFGIDILGSPLNKLFVYFDFSTTQGQWRTTNDIPTGLHHYAITYVNTAGVAPVIYKDAVSMTITTIANSVGTYRSGTANVFRAGSYFTGGLSINGNIQDIRIYNRILTAAEIAALAGSSRTLEMNDNGLVFHAPLMYAANRYPTVPFAGTLEATDYTYDRINGVQGTPSGSPNGAVDMVYGTAF